MQQLWLDHKRIDSISQLRGLLAEAAKDPEGKGDELCVCLLEYMEQGILRRWLSRQRESVGGSLDTGEAELTKAVKLLCREDGEPADKRRALSAVTGLPETAFSAERVGRIQDGTRKLREEKMKQIREQDWWERYREIFDQGTEPEWQLVALNNSQLQLALEDLRRDGKKHRTLYLCNTEEMWERWYVLNLTGITNATVIGIGAPRVQYDRFSEDRCISLERQNLFLQDMTLCFHRKNCLEGPFGRFRNYEVVMK